MIYFIRAKGGFGPVKIGHSSFPPARLDALMTWAPYPLEIVATVRGGYQEERRFHSRFADTHSHREWFHPSPDLERTIEQIQLGLFDVNTLPDGKHLRRFGPGPTPKPKPLSEAA